MAATFRMERYDRSAGRWAGSIRHAVEGAGDMGTYIAIAEPATDNHSWWITFPALPGVVTAANSPMEIARKAGDALAAASRGGREATTADRGSWHYPV
jgi:hypothetical protein